MLIKFISYIKTDKCTGRSIGIIELIEGIHRRQADTDPGTAIHRIGKVFAEFVTSWTVDITEQSDIPVILKKGA